MTPTEISQLAAELEVHQAESDQLWAGLEPESKKLVGICIRNIPPEELLTNYALIRRALFLVSGDLMLRECRATLLEESQS